MADKYNLNKDDLPKGVGTGFIWDKKGHIITNFHVINKVDNAIITITDKNNIKKNYKAIGSLILLGVIIVSLLFFLTKNISSSIKDAKDDDSRLVEDTVLKPVDVVKPVATTGIKFIDKKDNIIKGKNCFVFANGERMDCCVDEDFSFRVEKKNKISYEGVLFSCYDDLEYRIRINFEKKHISFHFIGSSHPFVPKELKLYKE